MSSPPAIGLATCEEVAELDAEGRLLLERLADRGLAARPVVWTDEAERWGEFDLVIVRSTWDYHRRPEAFRSWARSLEGRILNPLPLIEWSVSKRYLADLLAWGVPIVPTSFIGPGERLEVPAEGDFVLKPVVSAGSKDTARYSRSDADLAAAGRHLARLQGEGREAMVQPYFDAVDSEAETAVIFIGGEFSHSMRKGPLLELGQGLEEGLFRQEEMSPRDPGEAMLRIARVALAAVEERLGSSAYARVDLLPAGDGAPHVLEVELVEPSLFLDFHPPAAVALAELAERHLRPR